MTARKNLVGLLGGLVVLFIFALILAPNVQATETFTVTNTNDSGLGSLRQAIQEANDSPGLDTIEFDIAGDGSHTIQPADFFPPINDPVTIDGYSQPGATPATADTAAILRIEIDGVNAGHAIGFLFDSGSDGSTVKGLVMNRFGEAGIKIEESGNHTITGSYFGTDVYGVIDLGNGWAGVRIDGGGYNNTIGGDTPAERNILSGNHYCGVCINDSTSTGNIVSGNYIGTDVNGRSDLGNGMNGVSISNGAYGNTIGGDTLAKRNILSGNGDPGTSGFGINVSYGSHDNLIIGNYHGTNFDGTYAVGNNNTGVTLGVGVYDNVVQNALISGNGISGVALEDIGTTGNRIVGNYIGTNAAGTSAIPNVINGVFLGWEVQDNTIGGTTAAERNIISGNGHHGIRIAGQTDSFIDPPSNNTVIGNYIGTTPDGTRSLGNGQNGINIVFGANNNKIGGDTPAERNIISGNGQDGIFIGSADLSGEFPTGNMVIGNYIGTTPDGAGSLGNSESGINIHSGASNNLTKSNLIASNGLEGIRIHGDETKGNTIVANSIHSNHGLGVDLSGDGVTLNDFQDLDIGPNSLQNFPELTEAIMDDYLTVKGNFNSTPFLDFTLDFYSSGSLGSDGVVQGETYLGSTDVSADADGNAYFSADLIGVSVLTGHYISATATNLATGNTSEFSQPAVSVGDAPVTCVVPERGMKISEDTHLCADNYSIKLWPLEPAIEIISDDVTVTCEVDENGKPTTISNPFEWGIGLFSDNHKNITVKNCSFTNMNFGMMFRRADNILLESVKLVGNKRGIHFAQGLKLFEPVESHNNEILNSEIWGNTIVDIAVYYDILTIDGDTNKHNPITLIVGGGIEVKKTFVVEYPQRSMPSVLPFSK